MSKDRTILYISDMASCCWSWCCSSLISSFSFSHPIPYTYISRTDGSWLGFGYNNGGQLGLGDTSKRYTPTALPALGTSTVESCVLGDYHTLCKK
jgi:hypothetical protein